MNTRHWQLADGSYRAEIHMQPIHYQATDGSWQPVDTRLATSRKAGFSLANETNTLKSYLPSRSGGWVRLETDRGSLSFRPLNALDAAASLTDHRLQFDGIGKGVSLSYSVEPGQLKELITLNEPIPPPTFQYAIELDGLSARRNPDNSIAFLDAEGNGALTIAAPWMKDAAGRFSEAIAVNLTQSTDGFVYAITPNPKWLASAQYPVIVDPTVTVCTIATPSWAAANLLNRPNEFWTPGLSEYYQDDSPSSGEYLVVGAEGGQYPSAPARGVLSFDMAAIPAGSSIHRAVLSMTASHATGSANMQVQIYRVNRTLKRGYPLGQGEYLPTPSSIGKATDLASYESTLAPLEPGFWATVKTFQVTSLAQDWATDQQQAMNFLMRDTQEDVPVADQLSSRVYFAARNSSLKIDYNNGGWYAFQGNTQRTGLAAQPLSPNLAKKWHIDLAGPTDRKFPSNDFGDPTPDYQYLEPGVLAVQDQQPSSNRTIVYAAVGFMPITAPPGQQLRPYTRVYRVKVKNSDGTLDGTPSFVTIDGFYATGTPLVVANALVLTGITNFLWDQNQYPQKGRVVALDSYNLAPKWTRDLPGTIYSSPVYYSGDTTYTDQTGAKHTHQGGAVIVAADRFIIPPYIEEQRRSSYLFALSLADGQHVWGKTYRTWGAQNGDLVPDVVPPTNQAGYSYPSLGGLVPLVWNSTYSSPAIMGDGVYVQDHSCAVNARNLSDGTFRWERTVDMMHEQSTVSVFDNKLFWGGMSVGAQPYPGIGCLSSMEEGEVPSGFMGVPRWTTEAQWGLPPSYPDLIGAVWGGVVVHPTERIAVFADLAGNVHGTDADGHPLNYTTFPRWSAPESIGSPMFCSPLLARDSATNRYHAFIGADDGKVHVLQAQQTPVGNRRVGILTDGGLPLNGPIRSSMAAFNGRLFVLSAGETDANGVFTKVPRLYGFGQ